MALNISKEYTLEHIANKSFDKTTQMNAVQGLGFDGTTGLQRQLADNLQIYAVDSGGYNYFCFAAVGTALATAKWMVFRIDSTGNKLYADANAEFDNIATDPTLLNFVYNV
jgi:hypothetical protein